MGQLANNAKRSMKTISYSFDNVGGVAGIIAIPIEVFNRLAPVFGTDTFHVSVGSSDNIIEIPVLWDDSFSFSEVESDEEAGRLFKIDIKGKIPRQDADGSIIRTLEYGRWIVMCQDRNGCIRAAGTRLVPMQFASGRTMGGNSAANGNAFSFFNQQERPSELVLDTLIFE